MPTDRYELDLAPNSDEVAWFDTVVETAGRMRCRTNSVSGAMWASSKGRAVAFHIHGEKNDLLKFAVARPTSPPMRHVRRWS